jgi:hypothetical protein
MHLSPQERERRCHRVGPSRPIRWHPRPSCGRMECGDHRRPAVASVCNRPFVTMPWHPYPSMCQSTMPAAVYRTTKAWAAVGQHALPWVVPCKQNSLLYFKHVTYIQKLSRNIEIVLSSTTTDHAQRSLSRGLHIVCPSLRLCQADVNEEPK